MNYKLKDNIKKQYLQLKNNEYVRLAIAFLFYFVILFIFDIGCPTRFLYGVCCPGCGLTRASVSLLKLDFNQAIYYHPLVFLIPVIAFLFIVKDKINQTILNTLLVLIIIVFIIVYCVRLIDVNNEVVYIDFRKGVFFKVLNHIK